MESSAAQVQAQTQANTSSTKPRFIINKANLYQIQTLFRGLVPTLFATSTLVGVQNMTYDGCINATTSYMGLEPSITLFMTCGAASGFTAQGVVYPLDVLRRRIQVYGINNPQHNMKRFDNTFVNQMPQIFKKAYFLVRTEGISILYKGILATYLKTVPSIAIAMSVRDVVMGKNKKSIAK